MFLTVIKSWKEKSLQATLDSVIMEISTRFCAPLIPRTSCSAPNKNSRHITQCPNSLLQNYHNNVGKLKLQKSHNLEEEKKIDFQDLNNCISQNQQSDIGEQIDNHLSRFNINPPIPGTQIDLSHISNDVIKSTEQLFENYSKAFASHHYDTGAFSWFTATNRGRR